MKKTADWIIWAVIAIFFIGLPLDTSIVRNLAKGIGLPQNVGDAIVVTANLGILFGVIPAISVVGGRRVWRYNRRVYPRLVETWQKSWRCERCGSIWAIDY